MGESASGQYAYVSKFSAIVSIIISIYSLAWQEQAFLYADREDRGDIYAYYINNFIKCIGLAIPSYILLSCFASPYIGGNGYLQATILIPMIVLSAFLADLSGIFSVVIAVNERTDQTFISTVMGAIVNVILVNFLVKKYGANGASLSEGIPVSIMEAISFGIPIIATNVGGNAEIVNDETGVLIPVNIDQAAFNETVSDIMNKMDILKISTILCYQNEFNADKNYHCFYNQITL